MSLVKIGLVRKRDGTKKRNVRYYLVIIGSQEEGRGPRSGVAVEGEERAGTERREEGKGDSWPGGGISASTAGASASVTSMSSGSRAAGGGAATVWLTESLAPT